MATAEQIKALIRSHLDEDDDRFHTLALQVAAHEARKGNSSLAQDIKGLVQKAKDRVSPQIVAFPDELNGLMISEKTNERIAQLVVPSDRKERVERIAHEYRQRGTLQSHGMGHRRKILLSGPPGTGKTLTARALAGELGLPLRTIQMDRLTMKFMGETAAKLRQIFEIIADSEGVFLFDEFDAIGGDRGRDNDVGEMRRVLNSFLQFIEADRSDNLLVAATNNIQLLDRALFRRFDDVLHYSLPEEDERERLIKNVLGTFAGPKFPFPRAAASANQLSHAEIDQACRDAIKTAILSGKKSVSGELLTKFIKERRASLPTD